MPRKTRLKRGRKLRKNLRRQRGGTIPREVLRERWDDLDSVTNYYGDGFITKLQDFEKDFTKEQIDELIEYASNPNRIKSFPYDELMSNYLQENNKLLDETPQRKMGSRRDVNTFAGHSFSFMDDGMTNKEIEQQKLKLAAAPYYQFVKGSPPASPVSRPGGGPKRKRRKSRKTKRKVKRTRKAKRTRKVKRTRTKRK